MVSSTYGREPRPRNDMSLHDAVVLAILPAVIKTCSGDILKHSETREQMFVRKARDIADAMIAPENLWFMPQDGVTYDRVEVKTIDGALHIREVKP